MRGLQLRRPLARGATMAALALAMAFALAASRPALPRRRSPRCCCCQPWDLACAADLVPTWMMAAWACVWSRSGKESAGLGAALGGYSTILATAHQSLPWMACAFINFLCSVADQVPRRKPGGCGVNTKHQKTTKDNRRTHATVQSQTVTATAAHFQRATHMALSLQLLYATPTHAAREVPWLWISLLSRALSWLSVAAVWRWDDEAQSLVLWWHCCCCEQLRFCPHLRLQQACLLLMMMRGPWLCDEWVTPPCCCCGFALCGWVCD